MQGKGEGAACVWQLKPRMHPILLFIVLKAGRELHSFFFAGLPHAETPTNRLGGSG